MNVSNKTGKYIMNISNTLNWKISWKWFLINCSYGEVSDQNTRRDFCAKIMKDSKDEDEIMEPLIFSDKLLK